MKTLSIYIAALASAATVAAHGYVDKITIGTLRPDPARGA